MESSLTRLAFVKALTTFWTGFCRRRTCVFGGFVAFGFDLGDFRPEALSLKVTDQLDRDITAERLYHNDYPSMRKTLGSFQLDIDEGGFSDSEIIVLLGENGTGKSTMIQMLAGKLKPDDPSVEVPELSISYKPQKISPKYEGTVRQLLMDRILDMLNHPTFKTDVMKPLEMERLLDLEVSLCVSPFISI